jgi:hypothetical protein
LVGQPELKRPLGRHRHRWEDNIIVDRRKIRWAVLGWMELALDWNQWKDLVNTVMNFRVP